jgi:hypothetical protein
LYGGTIESTKGFAPPPDNIVLAYEKYQYGPEKTRFQSSFVNNDLPSDMTRLLAYGAGANAPSENLAWYFSGMRSPTWGEIYINSNASTVPSVVSDTLITLDMTNQQQETWSNVTLPPSISGRGNPELVWVPIGEKGILVALGGVLYPQWASLTTISTNATGSVSHESPSGPQHLLPSHS